MIRRTDQALVKALERKIKMMRVHPEGVQDRRLEIIDVDRILDRRVTEIIRFAIGSELHSTTGHPHREAVWVMITAERRP